MTTHPTTSPQNFIQTLRTTLPALTLSQNADTLQQACTDWRKRYHTHAAALAIVYPNTTQEVAQITALCNQHNIALCTQGGNTGLAGGAVPLQNSTRPHLLLSTTYLRDTLTIDAHNLTLTASAGYTLAEIQAAADQAGFLFPLSLASEGTCTLGGNLGTNAGGVAVLRYGNARELCLSLEFVNAEGQVCGDLRGLRKNNTGYDLRHLLIGSEGTLGIITRACMKLFPKPKSTMVAWLHVRNIQTAVVALHHLQTHLHNELTSYEWMNAQAIALVQKHHALNIPGLSQSNAGTTEHVLVQFDSLHNEHTLREQIETGLNSLLEDHADEVSNALLAKNLGEQQAWWSIRERIPESQSREGLNVKHDIACAVSRLPQFHDEALSRLHALNLNIRPILFGHLGDGNLHFNISGPENTDSQTFLKTHQDTIHQTVYECILKAEGTISAEHGIGQQKTELLKHVTPNTDYALLQALKTAIDPKGILNPGKVVN